MASEKAAHVYHLPDTERRTVPRGNALGAIDPLPESANSTPKKIARLQTSPCIRGVTMAWARRDTASQTSCMPALPVPWLGHQPAAALCGVLTTAPVFPICMPALPQSLHRT